MSVISWGRHQRVAFSNSGRLQEWAPDTIPALFAVTYQRDPFNKPKGHTVLYFGETDNMAEKASSIKHNMKEVWSRDGGDPSDLFIFVRQMDGSTTQERFRILERLILEYQPEANRHD